MHLHREGFERTLELAADMSLGGPALVSRLADDPLVGPLLLIHGAHPYTVDARLGRALERLRPLIAAQGCRASLVDRDERQVRVRLEGGARLSERSDLMGTIEARLLEVAPELALVHIETVDAQPAISASPPLIQILKPSPAAKSIVSPGTES